MKPDPGRRPAPIAFSTVEIDPALTRPKAVVPALLAAANTAIARVAGGELWEGEREILIDAGRRAYAERMALIWQRTAQHMQRRETDASRQLPRDRSGPARCIRHEHPID